MVFQNFGLFPHRTILENTEYGLEVRGVPKEDANKKQNKHLKTQVCFHLKINIQINYLVGCNNVWG